MKNPTPRSRVHFKLTIKKIIPNYYHLSFKTRTNILGLLFKKNKHLGKDNKIVKVYVF